MMKIIISLAIIILIIGYYFKEEVFVFNVKDTYYVISYFTIAIYILYALGLFALIKFIVSKNKI
jgi:heme/copper-type cytochrome/quinol oxidase subunit 1